jgi:transcriptional regulator with XRE-family HTH domain
VTTNNRQRLAQAVTHRRLERGITGRRALAELAGVSKQTIDNLENGRRAIQAATMFKIEDALEWAPGTMHAILAGAEPDATAPASGNRPPPGEQDELERMRAKIELLEMRDRINQELARLDRGERSDPATREQFVRDLETLWRRNAE